MKKKILVPVDLSGATVQVCNAARDLALALDARLMILHAAEPDPMVGSYYALSTFEGATLSGNIRKRLAAKMQALGGWFHKTVPDTKVILHTGSPVPTILRFARLAHPDYIVVGSHGHTAAYEVLVGSVAHRLIRKAPCPVVVVPISPQPRRVATRATQEPKAARVELASFR